MKTQYKLFISLIIIVILILCYHFYVRKQYLTLNPEDRGLIIQSFGKDSDGKGYSDEGHKMMLEDADRITNFTPQQKQEFISLYKSMMINKRKYALSENKEEFLKNEKLYNETIQCWTLWLVLYDKEPNTNLNFFNSSGSLGEKEELNDYLDVLNIKYHRSVSDEELNAIINPDMKYEDCRKFL